MLPANHILQKRYRIIQPLGKGGMGHVYEAMDEAVDCVVAIKETFAATDKLRRAFEREAKLLANLRHPVLPRVTHHFIEGDGQFLVMDYIDGFNLSELLAQRKRPFTAEELLPQADKLLSALHYLHTRSEPIIHRDIKPANIKRTSEGEIYLLDFGLAKGSAGQMSTMEPGESFFSSVYGYTAAYAPLEQLTNAGTNAQSDLYGLGATLYHLLTGQAPLSANVRYEAIEMAAGDPLPTVHQLNPQIPPAVSDVIANAMAMSRRDRTRTASEMREALAEAMRGVPAVATVGSSAEEQSTMIMPASAEPQSEARSAEVSWPSQIGPSTPSSTPSETPLLAVTEAARTDYAERVIEAKEPKAIKTMIADAPQAAPPAWGNTAASSSFQLIDQRKSPIAKILVITAVLFVLLVGAVVTLIYLLSGRPTNTNAGVNTSSPVSKPVPAAHNYSFGRDLVSGQNVVWAVAFSPNGKHAVSAGDDKRLDIWSAPDWQHKKSFSSGSINSATFATTDPDMIAAAGNDGKIGIYNLNADTMAFASVKAPDEVYFLAFSPSTRVLASVGKDKAISLWDWLTGESRGHLTGHTDVIWAVAFSPDGKLLASASKDKTVRIWHELNGGWESRILNGHTSAVISVAFSPDGKVLATGSDDNTIKLWNTNTWEEVRTFTGHTSYVTSLAFSPDGGTLVSGSNDNSIRLWDVQTGELRQLLNGHTKGVTSVCLSPDGNLILSAGRDGAVKLWQ